MASYLEVFAPHQIPCWANSHQSREALHQRKNCRIEVLHPPFLPVVTSSSFQRCRQHFAHLAVDNLFCCPTPAGLQRVGSDQSDRNWNIEISSCCCASLPELLFLDSLHSGWMLDIWIHRDFTKVGDFTPQLGKTPELGVRVGPRRVPSGFFEMD